jgi:glutathione S-transferase
MGMLSRAMLRKPADQGDLAALEAARGKASASWAILDRALADRTYVAGAELTLGDIALGNAIHRWYRLPIERPALQRLQGWYTRLCERPSYSKYIASVGTRSTDGHFDSRS